jgi:hypothetical protein
MLTIPGHVKYDQNPNRVQALQDTSDEEICSGLGIYLIYSYKN